MHNSGIAIKTTFSDFKNCLKNASDEVFVGNIEYIDPYEYSVPHNINEMSMLFTWYFHKRKPFQYEREFRAVIAHYPRKLMELFDNQGNLNNPETTFEDIEFPDYYNLGMSFNVDISILIQEVIISPYFRNKEWITRTVNSVIKQYDYDFEVNPSKILDDPS